MVTIYTGKEKGLLKKLIAQTIEENEIDVDTIATIQTSWHYPDNNEFKLWIIKIDIWTVNNGSYYGTYYSQDTVYGEYGSTMTYQQFLKLK